MMRPPTCSGQPAFGLTQNLPIWHSLFHLFEDAEQLRRSARTVDADHVRASFVNFLRHLRRIIAKQGAVIAGECDRGNDGQGAGLPFDA